MCRHANTPARHVCSGSCEHEKRSRSFRRPRERGMHPPVRLPPSDDNHENEFGTPMHWHAHQAAADVSILRSGLVFSDVEMTGFAFVSAALFLIRLAQPVRQIVLPQRFARLK